MRTWRWYSKGLFVLLVFAFGYYVWPTPWQYHTTGGTLLRVHRVTGRVQRTHAEGLLGWRDISSSEGDLADQLGHARTFANAAEEALANRERREAKARAQREIVLVAAFGLVAAIVTAALALVGEKRRGIGSDAPQSGRG